MADYDVISPRQTNLKLGDISAYNPAYNIYFPIEGSITFVHYPADSTNKSKREIEYDVQPSIPNWGLIKNVPLAVGVHGITDDDETVLLPARLVIPSGSFDANTHGPATDTDGDRVLVQFVNGSFLNPVITHVLSHSQRGRSGQLPSKYSGKLELLTPGPADADGYQFGDGSAGSAEADLKSTQGHRFRHTAMNGTHLAIDYLGNVFINFKENPDPDAGISAGNVTKKLVIQNEGKDIFRVEMESGGSLKVVLGETFASNILAQVGDGAVKVAIADNLKTLYNDLKTALNTYTTTHTHTGVTTGPGSTGTSPTPLNPPVWEPAIESNKLKIPSN